MTSCRAIALASATLALAACDSPHGGEAALDPIVALHLAAMRADPDAALADKVKAALGAEPGQGGAYDIEATVSEGTVDLWGTVSTSAVRKRLVTTAAGVVGVRALRNHIRVDPGA